MSTKLWAELQTTEKTVGPIIVSVDGCDDVHDFLKEIQKAFTHSLSGHNATHLTLYKPDGTTGIQPTVTLNSLAIAENSRATPLVVKAIVVAKSSRLVAKHMSAEVSCRRFLDAIAFKLSTYYVFSWKYNYGATFGDVLETIGNGQKQKWDYILEGWTYEQEDENGDMVQVNEGDPAHPIPLPLLFTDDEWAKLEQLHKSTPERRLSAFLLMSPQDVHSEFSEEMISLLKNVGVKATLFSSPDFLKVFDEGDI